VKTCPKRGISSIDWVQMGRLLPEDGDIVQSPKRCFLNISWTMDNVQKVNNCENMSLTRGVPSLADSISYYEAPHLPGSTP
jgi:hypothetical protein